MRTTGQNLNIVIDNLRVSYTDLGSDNRQVIIFIHGFPFNKTMWNDQLEALKENYRVIAYDIRGFGSSNPGQSDFTIDLFADDLINLMDALKIKKAIVCGLSMGGYIALNAIGRYPKRFEALVLSDTTCMPDTPEIKAKRLLAIENVMEKGVENYAEASLKNFFAIESFTQKQEEIGLVKTMILNTPKTSICKALIAMCDRNETESILPEIKVPVHVMVGEQDTITPLASAQFMNLRIKNSSLSIITQAGHLANIDNPTEFNDQLRKFADWFVQSSLDFKMDEAYLTKD